MNDHDNQSPPILEYHTPGDENRIRGATILARVVAGIAGTGFLLFGLGLLITDSGASCLAIVASLCGSAFCASVAIGEVGRRKG